MARICESEWFMQEIGGLVILFRDYDEEEIVRFDPTDANAVAQAQKTIHDTPFLNDEEKSFAHFWSGYFYAYGSGLV